MNNSWTEKLESINTLINNIPTYPICFVVSKGDNDFYCSFNLDDDTGAIDFCQLMLRGIININERTDPSMLNKISNWVVSGVGFPNRLEIKVRLSNDSPITRVFNKPKYDVFYQRLEAINEILIDLKENKVFDDYILLGSYNKDLTFCNYNNSSKLESLIKELLLSGSQKFNFNINDFIDGVKARKRDKPYIIETDLNDETQLSQVSIIKGNRFQKHYFIDDLVSVKSENRIFDQLTKLQSLKVKSYIFFMRSKQNWYLSYPDYNDSRALLSTLYFGIKNLLKHNEDIESGSDLQKKLDKIITDYKIKDSDNPIWKKGDSPLVNQDGQSNIALPMELVNDISDSIASNIDNIGSDTLREVKEAGTIDVPTNNVIQDFMLIEQNSDDCWTYVSSNMNRQDQAGQRLELIENMLLAISYANPKTDTELWEKFGNTMELIDKNDFAAVNDHMIN